MHRSLSGRRLRPPSPSRIHRRGHHSLSVQTANQLSQQMSSPPQVHNEASTSPAQDIYPSYPLPIPEAKQAKARKLYRQYQMEATLEQSKHEPQSATSYSNFLSVPGPQSVTSRTSSKHNRAASISTSAYDLATELSSVVSFEAEEPFSPKSKAQGEMLSFNGTPVKPPRTRNRLSSVKRAKAALIRHLGSCRPCHNRKVPCSLDHHDLDILLQSAAVPNRPQLQDMFLSPTTSSQNTESSMGEGQQSQPIFSQGNDLAGIEGNAGLDDMGPIETTLDIRSPGSYEDTQLPTYALATIGFEPIPLPVIPYETLQNGEPFPLGVQNDVYHCRHLSFHHVGGTCDEIFETVEELQNHFEASHFSFTRITPAHRNVCSECQQWNNNAYDPCTGCNTQGSIQRWIYGHYIRIPSYWRHASDGQDFQEFGPIPDLFDPGTFTTMAWNFGADQFDGNAGTGGFNMHDEDVYRGPGSQAYGYDPSSGSTAGDSQFQGSFYGGAQQFALVMPNSIRLKLARIHGNFTNRGIKTFLLFILSIMVFVFNLPRLQYKVEPYFQHVSSVIQAQLPSIGFLGILASFALSILLKSFNAQRRRRTQSRHYPLHALTNTSIPFKHRTSAYTTHCCVN